MNPESALTDKEGMILCYLHVVNGTTLQVRQLGSTGYQGSFERQRFAGIVPYRGSFERQRFEGVWLVVEHVRRAWGRDTTVCGVRSGPGGGRRLRRRIAPP